MTTLRLDQVGPWKSRSAWSVTTPPASSCSTRPTEEPDYENDWLLDIRLYSRSFRADRASILLQELGLANQHLRQHLADRRKFFDAKERLQKIKAAGRRRRRRRRPRPQDDRRRRQGRPAGTLQYRPDPLPRLDRGGSEIDLDDPPAGWEQIEKFDLDGPFWQMVKAAFGYDEENPSLKNFLLRLLVTDYAHHLKGDVPQRSVACSSCPAPAGPTPSSAWPSGGTAAARGAATTGSPAEVAGILKIDDHLHGPGDRRTRST